MSTTFTKEIAYDRFTKDYTATVDGQLIGSFSTHHEAEVAADAHVFNLLSDGLHIPASTLDGICGDCGATLDSMGLCRCQTEEPARTVALCNDCAHDAALRGSLGPRIGAALVGSCGCCQVDNQPIIQYELKDRLPAWLAETPRHTIACICGAVGTIVTSGGTLCGACYEAQSLWRLWKTDSTAFVAELRRQSCRLNEMAARLATYLSRKHSAHLSCDSILAMWRLLLDDGDPPEPRSYVVAAWQPVVA